LRRLTKCPAAAKNRKEFCHNTGRLVCGRKGKTMPRYLRALVLAGLMAALLLCPLYVSAAALDLVAIGEGISPRTGGLYAVDALDRPYTFSLHLEATRAYRGGSVRVTPPEGLLLEYHPSPSDLGTDWIRVTPDTLILTDRDLAPGDVIEIPLRVTLRQAGDHPLSFTLFEKDAPGRALDSLKVVWRAPLSRYAISFGDLPSDLSGGDLFQFKAYVRHEATGNFDYQGPVVLKVTATPHSQGVFLREKEGPFLLGGEAASEGMEILLPEPGGMKTVLLTAQLPHNGQYNLHFVLAEAGEEGRLIAEETLTLQVGQTTPPYTGPGHSGRPPALPYLTLLLFVWLGRIRRAAEGRT
jgi:hypothetical protein